MKFNECSYLFCLGTCVTIPLSAVSALGIDYFDYFGYFYFDYFGYLVREGLSFSYFWLETSTSLLSSGGGFRLNFGDSLLLTIGFSLEFLSASRIFLSRCSFSRIVYF